MFFIFQKDRNTAHFQAVMQRTAAHHSHPYWIISLNECEWAARLWNSRIAGEPERRHLLSVTAGLCGSSGSHNDYFCRKSSNKAGIISFLYFGPFTGRVTYHITISQKAHASMLHCLAHSHTVWPDIYLMSSSVCVLATPQWVQHDCIIQ